MSNRVVQVEFLDAPATFLEVAGAHLAVDPVVSTVIATVTERMGRRGWTGLPYEPWWLVARDGQGPSGDIVGVGMRTAPFEPYPLYLLPMPDGAAVAVARALHERGEPVVAINGAAPAALVAGEEVARLTGGRAEVTMHTRLFDLPALVSPPSAPEGLFRTARADELDLVDRWFDEFLVAADEQAGRGPGERVHAVMAREEVAARIDDGVVGLWVVDGEVRHLTAWNPPAFGVCRVGPVYTPLAHRGRGYASAAVAEASRRILAAGHRACLFTDQANPTSNRVYEALGYRPLVDMVDVVVR